MMHPKHEAQGERPTLLCCGKCGCLPVANFVFQGGELLGTIRCGNRRCDNRTRRAHWLEAKEEWNGRTGRARSTAT
jgi:hypothetical protein